MGITDNNNNITFFHYGLAVGLFIGLMIRSIYMPCPNKADEKPVRHDSKIELLDKKERAS